MLIGKDIHVSRVFPNSLERPGIKNAPIRRCGIGAFTQLAKRRE
jgi:hypothetical protein